MGKVKSFLDGIFNDPVDEDEESPELVTEEKTDEFKEEPIVEKADNNTTRTEGVKTTPSYPKTNVGGSPAVLELKVVRPEEFKSVGQIADHLLNRCTVVLNLEAADAETARRIVDFLNGVAYSIDGQLKPVANKTFIITPKNVSVSGEQLNERSDSRTSSHASDEF